MPDRGKSIVKRRNVLLPSGIGGTPDTVEDKSCSLAYEPKSDIEKIKRVKKGVLGRKNQEYRYARLGSEERYGTYWERII